MKILIVKLSSLGDVVHSMAAVQDLRQAFPHAQIDWVVERGFSSLVRRCEGVNRVIESNLRRWRKEFFKRETRAQWAAFKLDLQLQTYDVVLDLQGLTKSALVARLARLAPGGKRYALANQTNGSSYEAPTRWLADVAVKVQPRIHAVDRSRVLCAQALDYTPPNLLKFGLLATVNSEQLAIKKVANERFVALVHGTSRRDKEWPLSHWIELGRRLNASGYSVVLPHGSDAERQFSQDVAAGLLVAQVLPPMALDQLVDQLAQCEGLIGVDSGLSHIAVALDLLHVQIYNFDTAWRTGPTAKARKQMSVFAQPTPSVDAVWHAWLGCQSGITPQHGDAVR